MRFAALLAFLFIAQFSNAQCQPNHVLGADVVAQDTVTGKLTLILKDAEGNPQAKQNVVMDMKWYEMNDAGTSVTIREGQETFYSNAEGMIETGLTLRGTPAIKIYFGGNLRHSFTLEEKVDGTHRTVEVTLCD